MTKSITVSYFAGNSSADVQLNYTIQMLGAMQTIACTVMGNHFPNWLQLRKFEMMSQQENNWYVPMFNETNNSKNMDTVLFIDQVYTSIMQSEKLKVRTAETA